jgi:hypothetical protein
LISYLCVSYPPAGLWGGGGGGGHEKILEIMSKGYSAFTHQTST